MLGLGTEGALTVGQGKDKWNRWKKSQTLLGRSPGVWRGLMIWGFGCWRLWPPALGAINCKRLRAPPRQPGRPQERRKEGFTKKGRKGRAGGGGGRGGVKGGGGGTPAVGVKRDPPQHGFASSSKQLGGGPTGRGRGGGGWRQKGGPIRGLLVPDAFRQEAEAN